MGHLVQRFGIHIGRGWVALFLVVLVGLLAAYWIGPLRPLPPEIELLAVDGDQSVAELSVSAELDEGAGILRFPVPLAVRNVGAREGVTRRLVLSVPARYRVVTPRGRLTGEMTPGVPLRRYQIELPPVKLEPGAPPQQLTGLESLWLEPDLPRFYCNNQGNDVPEFIPAPRHEPGSISEVRIFYSIATRNSPERSTGLLTVHVDPAQLQVTPGEMPPAFPTTFEQTPLPDIGQVSYGGTRTAWCGDPEQPMELFTVTWQGQGGTRLFAIHVNDVARKLLWDVNGDGIIDREAWDVDGDGTFEARRQARYPVPDLLLPLPPRDPEMLEPDNTPRDSAWLAVFANAGAGPFRFAGVPTPAERLAAAAADTIPTDTTGMPIDTTGVEGAPVPAAAPGVALEPLPPPDSAWLALFNAADAGPFRFTRGRPAPAAQRPATPVPPATADIPQPADPVVAEPEPEPEPEPPPARRVPSRRVPLGTPVPPGGGERR
jgi:hypothetical protein